MPDNSRPSLRRLASTEPLDDLPGSAVLLVTADDLDTLTCICIHKSCAGAQYIKQRRWGQEPLDELFLLSLTPKRRGVVLIGFRPNVLPGVKVLVARCQGSELGLFATRTHQEQIRVEEPRLALAQTRIDSLGTTIAVAE